MQGCLALTPAKGQLGGTRAPWPQGSLRRGCPRGSPSFGGPDPPALQEEMLSWLQGVSTAINDLSNGDYKILMSTGDEDVAEETAE